MSTIVTRSGKGSPLTYAEMDANFTNLNTDKLETAQASTTYATKTELTNAVPSQTGNAGKVLTTNGTSTSWSAPASGALLAANNLSDVANVVTARGNLGLGTAATLSVGTSANSVVQLNESGALPAVSGANLTNLPTAAGLGYISGRYYGPEYGFTSASTTVSMIPASFLYLVPVYIRKSQLFSAISCCVTTLVASKLIRLGIYSDSNGSPGTLLYDAGTTSFGSTGGKDITLNQTLSAGWCWLALLTDSTGTGAVDAITLESMSTAGSTYNQVAFQFGRTSMTSNSGFMTHLRGTQAYGALPTTPPTLSAQFGNAPYLALKV